ncbi:MAG TPA: EamA family transporter [Victivallales bacterium]|nr:EamA family transporter [Victivallales bacterium]
MNESKMNSSYGLGFIIIAAICWGFSAVVLIPRLYNLPVVFVVFLQHAIPLALLTPFFFKEYKVFFKLPNKDIFILCMIALFSGVIGTLAIVKALFLVHFHNLSVVVLIQKVQPIFAIILAAIFLKECITKKFIFWSIFVFFGIYLITFGFNHPSIVLNESNFYAYMLSILSALSFALNTVLGKHLTKTVSYTTITFSRFFLGTIFSAVFCLVSGQLFHFDLITMNNFLILLAIFVAGGPISMLLYYYGLKYVKASTAAIGEMALPFSVIILDYTINHNSLDLIQWCGATIIIIGIFIISQIKTTKKQNNPQLKQNTN